MSRNRSVLADIQRASYLVSRTASDARAIQRGSGVYGKRLLRRRATRSVWGPLLRAFLR